MKVNAVKFYSIVFGIVLLTQLYFTFKYTIFIQLFVLSLFFTLEKPKTSLRFIKTIVPIIYLFIIGFVGIILYNYPLYNINKDVLHFIKPILGVILGYVFYRKINNIKLFTKTVIISGFISSIIHFLLILSIQRINNVSDIRLYGTDSFIELMAVLFLLFYKKFKDENIFSNKLYHYIILIPILFSSILYFSRTMIVMTVIAVLTIYGFTIITRQTIKIIVALIIFTIGFYIFLFSMNIHRNNGGVESFLYKIKNAPAEVFKSKVDRENHADLWDHWRGYEASRAFALLDEKPITYVFGCGYGSLVNLKLYAPLSKNDEKGMKYISELHNGYIYILYKTGIFGLFFYLFFLISLYYKIYINRNFVSVFISLIGLSYIVTTLVTVGINNSNDALMLVLGALLYFDEKDKLKKLSTND